MATILINLYNIQQYLAVKYLCYAAAIRGIPAGAMRATTSTTTPTTALQLRRAAITASRWPLQAAIYTRYSFRR